MIRRALALVVFLLSLAPRAPCASWLVAPFSNRTIDRTLDWIGESIAESVREALDAANLAVVSRADRDLGLRRLSLGQATQISFASAIKLAESTQSARVVYGRFDLVGTAHGASRGQLRLTARILDTGRAAQESEFAAQGAFADLARIQTELAWQIVRWTNPAPDSGAGPSSLEGFLRKHPPAKVPALESYIRGLMASSPEQRHRYLTRAARLDPSFPHPCMELGRMHWENENYRDAAAWFEKVSPGHYQYTEASFLLGVSRFELGDFDGALESFGALARLLDLAEVHNNLAAAQALTGSGDALANFRKALAANPADPDYHFNTGYALWKRGQFDEAAERFRAVLDRMPGDEDAIHLLGRCIKRAAPRRGDWRSEGLERLKDSYQAPVRK